MTQPTLFADPMDELLPTQLTVLVDAYGYETVALELARLAPTQVVPSAPARWGDPETSHLAAKREHDVGRFSSKSRQAKLLLVFSGGDYTHQQAAIRVVGAHAVPSAFDGCRRRCSDLAAVRYIVDSGRRRKNIGSDDESIVWTISIEGSHAVGRLEDTGWSR